MSLHPLKLEGPWKEGYALDFHSKQSIYMGDDANGKPMFSTDRTEIGELVYQLKYREDVSCVEKIIELVISFLVTWDRTNLVSYVIPVPASKQRICQPVYLIAERIANYLKVGWSEHILGKVKSDELKMSSIEEKERKIAGSIIKKKAATLDQTVLLVDDLYESGSTLRECVRVLREDPKIKEIYVLCLTKTKGKS